MKKYKRVMSHDMQSFKKNCLLVPKMTWGICWILKQAVTSLKIWTLMYCYFCQQHIKFQLKGTEELSLMTLKQDPNFEEKLTFCLENEMRNLVNFSATSKKSENLQFDRLLLKELNKYRSAVSWEMTSGFKNDISHFVNFHRSSWK